MRLLHVINSTNPHGGGPIEAIHQTVRELQPRGHENEIVCVDLPDSPWLADVECQVHALGPAATSYRYSARTAGWMEANLARFDAALVHSVWQHPGHALSRAARKVQVPYFVYTHGSLDPVHKRVFWMKHPQKMVMWVLKERCFLERSTGVFYTCEEERDLALNSFWPRLSGTNAAIVPYCTGEPPTNVERQKAEFRNSFPVVKDRPFLLFLSRLHPKKGPDLLLSAFAAARKKYPDHLLMMAGPGSDTYVKALQRQAENEGLKDVVLWPGMLRGDLKWGAFRTADAFVLCSHQENFGIAVVESLACRLPVLTTNRVNIWKTVADSNAGYIGTDTVESCSDMLEQWAELSVPEKNTMRQNARQCFETHYSAKQAAETLLQLFATRGVKNLQ
jgi:glycosyltransferase involved in cell wall biosynthesis